LSLPRANAAFFALLLVALRIGRRRFWQRLVDGARGDAKKTQSFRQDRHHLSTDVVEVDLLQLCNETLSLCIGAFLVPADLVRLGIASQALAPLAPQRLLPLLVALQGVGERKQGLADILHPPKRRFEGGDALICRYPCRSKVIEAAFNDAIAQGGDLKAALRSTDARGRTAVQRVVQMSWPVALSALLALGADVDVVDKASGWSPLMYSISLGDSQSAIILVKHGASVNFVAKPHGWTPLLTALASNQLRLLDWLLNQEADPEPTLALLRVNRHRDDFRGHETTLTELVAQRRRPGRDL